MTIEYKKISYDLTKKWATKVADTAALRTSGEGWEKRSGLPTSHYSENSSLIGWWRFNTDVSSAGDVPDSSGNSNPAIFSSISYRPALSSLTPATRIQKLSALFNGSGNRAHVPNPADNSLSFGDGTTDSPFSIAFWVRPTNTSFVGETIAEKDDEYLTYYKSPSGGGEFGFQLWDDSTSGYVKIETPVSSITSGQWYHVVVTYNGVGGATAYTGMKMYVNGTLVNTVGSGDGDYVSMEKMGSWLALGADSGGANGLEGNLIDFAVWNVELSANSAQNLYSVKNYDPYSAFINWSIKGTTTTLSSSVEPFYQGINAKTTEQTFGSMQSKMGPLTPFALYKDNERVSPIIFDDTLAMNSTLDDIRGVSDPNIQLRRNFQTEQRDLGQSNEWSSEDVFIDKMRFSPTVYLQDDEGLNMYPINLIMAGQIEKNLFDGTLEPFDIRRMILHYFGHDVRDARTIKASLNGGYGTTVHGNREISNYYEAGLDTTEFFYDGGSPFTTNVPRSIPGVYDLTKSFSANQKKYAAGGQLVAWWRLDKPVSAEGYISDSSTNEYSLIPPTTADATEFHPTSPSSIISPYRFPGWQEAGSAQWVGVNESVLEATDADAFTFGDGATDGPCSFSMWIKPTPASNTQYLMTKWNITTAQKEWGLQKMNDGKIRFFLFSAGTKYIRMTTINDVVDMASSTKWYHIVVTYDGSSSTSGVKIYVRGVEEATTPIDNGYVAMSNTTANVAIGNIDDKDPSEGFEGYMAEVAIWGRALSPDEVTALWNARLYIDDEKKGTHSPPTINQMNLQKSSISPFDDDTLEEEIYQPLLANNGHHDLLYKQVITFSPVDDGFHNSPNEKGTACGFTYGGSSRINSLVYGGEF